MVTYTCRYSSGHLIPVILSCQVSAGVGDHPCSLLFIYMILIDCKITNFPYLLLQLSHTNS